MPGEGAGTRESEGCNMSIEECYQQIGGDYNQVLARLMTPKLVIRFIGRFLEDNSFSMLEKALAEGNCKEAFRAAHTLKGVCQSLGLGNLLTSTHEITELLRHQEREIPSEAGAYFEAVRRDYEATVAAIREFQRSYPQNPV